jgi:hypothetical protein
MLGSVGLCDSVINLCWMICVMMKSTYGIAAAVAQPVEETANATAIRNLRRAICSLDVPEARLPALIQFKTQRW